MMQRTPARRSGFTLLELMIAMLLVALLAGTLAVSLAIGFRSRTAAEQSVETIRSVETVMEIFRTDLQCALPPSRGTFEGAFEGSQNQVNNIEADDLQFCTTAPSPTHAFSGVAIGNGEIKQIELTCYQPDQTNPNSDYVIVRRTINNLLPVNGQSEPPDEEVLCRHVAGFTLQYYDGQNWQVSWDSTQQSNSLPLAVMVSLALNTSDVDATGAPKVVTYTQIFSLPCTGVASGTTSGVSGSAAPSTGGGAK
jgi:prepilin-type N-terminal cleavage/methylation domain-containing protein